MEKLSIEAALEVRQGQPVQDENSPIQCRQSSTDDEVSTENDASSGGQAMSEPDIAIDEPSTCSHVPLPTSTRGCLTQAYERVLKNRIREIDILPGGAFDVEQDLPIFLHDCLMLPGSLAGKVSMSAEDLLPRMTPAILPGFHASIHSDTLEPCLTDSRILTDHVQGLLLFGDSKNNNRACQEHHGTEAKRIKARVELDVAVSMGDQLRLERCSMWAYVWMWRDPAATAFVPRFMSPEGWTIEKYVAGTLIPDYNESMRVSTKGEIGPSYDADVGEDSQGDDGVQEVGIIPPLHDALSTTRLGGTDVFTGW